MLLNYGGLAVKMYICRSGWERIVQSNGSSKVFRDLADVVYFKVLETEDSLSLNRK